MSRWNARRTLASAREEMRAGGVAGLQLLATDEEVVWFGETKRKVSTWKNSGIDLEQAFPVYQNMGETVGASIERAASGAAVDMNEARTVSEDLNQVTSDTFDDMFQIAAYPDFDAFTVGHSVRVALLAVYVGGHLGASQEILTELGAAGLMHDVGKGRIPRDILYKPGRLDADEWRVMAQHPTLGAEILVESADVSACALAAAWGHHLRFDGKGLPDDAVVGALEPDDVAHPDL